MNSAFIKAAEVWLPDRHGTLLEPGSGAFGRARRFAALSRSMCFGRGEGLPGRAWTEGRPLLLRQFPGSYFMRSAAAVAAGLNCAIAMPYFRGDELGAVLVIYCSHHPEHAGALELWRDDDAGEATLVDGAYGASAADFESLSRSLHLPPGAGLPGMALQQGRAQFIAGLPGAGGRFVRAAPAAQAGLLRGLAVPLESRANGGHVVSFLAAPGLPLAQRVERWAPDESKSRLRRVHAFGELHGDRSAAEAEMPIAPAAGKPLGAIRKAWTAGVPDIDEQPRAEPGAVAAAAAAIGAEALVAIPVVSRGAVTEVVALYL